MQRILGYMRKAIQEFDMIKDGDRIAVGVSGGKDSLCLLAGLSLLRRFIGIDYSLTAITLDPMFNGQPGSYDAVNQLCMAHGIEYRLIRTHIGEIVFDIRKEPNPCSLCARLRRGALHDAAKEAGCNVVALGHHYNDVVETFMMNLFIEGRVGCFSPKSYLSRKELYMIRPLVFAPETAIRSAVKRLEVEVVKSVCPADGATKREEMKEFIKDMEYRDKGFTDRLFGALRRSGVDGWGFKDKKAGELGSE
ncbi:MAG TPA: tRNA 2-thiocytidine(32) synthetase TtcA [Candidatus Faeciplasma avium]|uniref:tRNA 2-thiocytidine(32) synthetase TtcA n=1 Tax=Candidatus Faeciplasma avium TaxID=2840798 RepID=A0A9D1T3J4_9FIRM|nr:tRNA 2-thiocytidine(32) synthetase TtcA [Candidatus Faeciplasma avium]